MYQHQHARLPVEQLKAVPQPLVFLLELLLKKDPARRFQTPAELFKVMPMVRDAIDAGRRLIKTIRVFVSSTSDVQKERQVADRVMRSIAAEFNLRDFGWASGLAEVDLCCNRSKLWRRLRQRRNSIIQSIQMNFEIVSLWQPFSSGRATAASEHWQKVPKQDVPTCK
jgi:hypothetical protein